MHGVAAALQEEGLPVAGFDGVIHSTVPLRSGLSLPPRLNARPSPYRGSGRRGLLLLPKALLCQRAENRFVGVNCGILDQFTSCLVHRKAAPCSSIVAT